jgi:hypothetical protein
MGHKALGTEVINLIRFNLTNHSGQIPGIKKVDLNQLNIPGYPQFVKACKIRCA